MKTGSIDCYLGKQVVKERGELENLNTFAVKGKVSEKERIINRPPVKVRKKMV